MNIKFNMNNMNNSESDGTFPTTENIILIIPRSFLKSGADILLWFDSIADKKYANHSIADTCYK